MYRLAIVPGDGIGPEVIAEGLKVLEALAENHSLKLDMVELELGASRYLRSGELLTDEDLESMREADAVYFGAIGDPRVTPGLLERGILLRMRTVLDLFINYRPVRSWYPFTPLKRKVDFSIDFLRENTEDFYMGAGGGFDAVKRTERLRIQRGLYELELGLEAGFEGNHDFAFELGLLSREGVERFSGYVFEFARRRGVERVTVVDKANVCRSLYGLWREVFESGSERYGIDLDFMFVDAMAMALVRRPESFGVVATPNMFGDILTDLGAELQGGIGLAASGNICPGGPSMFEPVHGSAPDIAGKGIANPYGAILAAGMMLDHLRRADLAERIVKAVDRSVGSGNLTPDLGGTATTSEVGDRVVELVLADEPS